MLLGKLAGMNMINWGLRFDARAALELIRRLRARNAEERAAFLAGAGEAAAAAQAGAVYYEGYDRALGDLHDRLHTTIALDGGVSCR